MKEILFRGKRKSDEQWVQGFLLAGNDSSYIIPHSLGVTYHAKENRMMSFASEVEPETVCQYTGLTDKKGRKIFEGDIIHYTDEVTGEEKIDEIEYNETNAAFCRHHKSEMGSQYLFIDEAVANKCEVVGNVFDNSGLESKAMFEWKFNATIYRKSSGEVLFSKMYYTYEEAQTAIEENIAKYANKDYPPTGHINKEYVSGT